MTKAEMTDFLTSLVVCNHAVFFKGDNILIKILFNIKGYNANWNIGPCL